MDDLQACRTAYLASGDEALLPIVDAHHHFWDVTHNPHPWLQQRPRIAFRYGDYESICRDFLPEDYARAAGPHRVVGHVVMEGEWHRSDPVGEARWMSALAARCGQPQAMAAQIWLDRADVGEVLAQYAGLPLVRSVRHKPRCTTRAEYRADWAESGSMRCPRWRDGYARLAGAGLMFELQAPWWHMEEAMELARDFPDTVLIVNHAGLPAERDEASLAAWRGAMERLSAAPNVMVKISGLGVPGRAWTAELQQPVVEALLTAFGTQRCMFASNFPVDGLLAGLVHIFQVFKTLTRQLPPQQRLALFCDNACRIYRLH
jgi:predicted TIM-barrel fold metal-dependent hydrolase